ncbi:MAG: Rha family transcriptional regulator [Pisciglobus halotolerans]|nr:Rha family transcriptional regulator [Pisciglobus halotolerans]
MDNLVIMKDQQAVTTSLQISENFEKNHQHVLRDLDRLKEGVQNWTDLFWEDYYIHPQNKQRYRMIYMNRDGFTLLAMGFTGKRALEFKLKYIEAFNKMEQHIKQQLDTSNLSPELQMFNQMFKSLANQELETKELKEKSEKLENKVDGIKDLISMETKDWRKEVNGVIRKIAIRQGGFDKFKEIGNESYLLLEDKARCSLTIRLENRKKNMIAQGVGKSAIKRLNKLDIISEDHRLKEIYVSVVKNMAIKYGIWEEA